MRSSQGVNLPFSRAWLAGRDCERASHNVRVCAATAVVLALAQVGGIVYNSFLLGRAALGAATNITVNEEMNVARYEYLQGGHGGTFLNPFDEGAAANGGHEQR
jgi:hypothetical protein